MQTFYIKGDVSGIQDFIFDVKSDNAAKTLKARSFFIQVIGDMYIERLKKIVSSSNINSIYNAGGNFLLEVQKCTPEIHKKIEELNHDVEANFKYESISLGLAVVEKTNNVTYKDITRKISAAINQKKSTKFKNNHDAFDAYGESRAAKNYEEWKKFTKNLTEAGGFFISNGTANEFSCVGNKFNFFEKTFTLDNKGKNFKNSIVNKLPLDEDKSILEFDQLAEFAYQRTGTKKLGILKMDIDNLGDAFIDINEAAITKQLSKKLEQFFEQKIFEIWNQNGAPVDNNSMNRNIYVVFAGGDDCFAIGAWDKIIEFAMSVNDAFRIFLKDREVESLLAKIPSVKENPITLSAAIELVDAKYPVIKFADIAEDALHNAKYGDENSKNSISIFGIVIKWDDLKFAKGITSTLQELIQNDKQPRSILQRIQNSGVGFGKLQDKAVMGFARPPQVGRLFYYLRRFTENKSKEVQDKMEEIIRNYAEALLKAFISQKPVTNAAVFPIAARWAEFLTRKKS